MTRILVTAALFAASLASVPAHAMDDAERTRQLEIYQAHQQTGVAAVTKTTTVETTTQTAIPATIPVQAPVAKAHMAPLADDGTPLTVAPKTRLSLTTAEERQRQLEAYEAYKASQPVTTPVTTTTTVTATETAVTAPLATTGPVELPAGTTVTIVPGPTTTTTEKTTATNYTVTSRKVGLVGNRPYPARTSEVPGGVTREVLVNGELAKQEIVVPDTIDAVKTEKAEGDYYSNRRAARVYEDGNVHVHNTGRLNR